MFHKIMRRFVRRTHAWQLAALDRPRPKAQRASPEISVVDAITSRSVLHANASSHAVALMAQLYASTARVDRVHFNGHLLAPEVRV